MKRCPNSDDSYIFQCIHRALIDKKHLILQSLFLSHQHVRQWHYESEEKVQYKHSITNDFYNKGFC